ncbi:hypothetical protein ACR0ST_08620 [Aliidiomarina sp. Khilg15.8]
MNKLLIALFAALSMTTLAACSDQQRDSMSDSGERVEERAEETYNNIMNKLEEYKDDGEVCMSSLEGLREEWSEFTDSISADDVRNLDTEKLSEWGNNLQEEMDDMGDIVDHNC